MPSVQGGQSQVSSVPVKLRFNSSFQGRSIPPDPYSDPYARSIHTHFLPIPSDESSRKKLFQRLKVYFQTGFARKLLGGWIFFWCFLNPCLRKHLGDGAIPPLIEQHLLVNAWGPPPGIGGHCELFLSKCCTIFMKKERRRAKEGGPLPSRKGLRVQRKRSVRSDLGKKRNYKRKNTRTSQLRSFGNGPVFGARWEGCGAALSGALWCWKGINSKFVEPTKKTEADGEVRRWLKKSPGPDKPWLNEAR